MKRIELEAKCPQQFENSNAQRVFSLWRGKKPDSLPVTWVRDRKFSDLVILFRSGVRPATPFSFLPVSFSLLPKSFDAPLTPFSTLSALFSGLSEPFFELSAPFYVLSKSFFPPGGRRREEVPVKNLRLRAKKGFKLPLLQQLRIGIEIGASLRRRPRAVFARMRCHSSLRGAQLSPFQPRRAGLRPAYEQPQRWQPKTGLDPLSGPEARAPLRWLQAVSPRPNGKKLGCARLRVRHHPRRTRQHSHLNTLHVVAG